MLLGYLSGMLFWTIQCAGFFIDNQRGASMAEGPIRCPANGTSPLGSFFSRAPSTCFSTGAFLALLGVVYASYEIWPVTQLIPLSVFKDINLPLFFAGRVSWLLLMMLLLSGPIVVACLLTDVSLRAHQPLRFTAQRVCACHAHQERRRGFFLCCSIS